MSIASFFDRIVKILDRACIFRMARFRITCVFAAQGILLLFCAGCDTADKTPRSAPEPFPGMVLIPAGQFTMGADDADARGDEKPAHAVYLDAFYIDRYEVTNRQYREFILATGRPAPRIEQPWAGPYNWNGTDFPEGRADHPVVLVSWDDACQYCAWVGKRLPTEAEWEKAARGGLAAARYPRGDDISLEDGNYDKGLLHKRQLTRVGSFAPNGYGLHDMAGNVWEWCRDWYSESYYRESPKNNPAGPEEGLYRLFRGGAWINDEKFLRCSRRGKNTPDYKSHAVGFRCALSAPQAAPR